MNDDADDGYCLADERVKRLLRDATAEVEPPAGWQDRVWERIERENRATTRMNAAVWCCVGAAAAWVLWSAAYLWWLYS